MDERTIDARGKACPQPVIETRKALQAGGTTSLLVLVDNQAASENVSRMAHSLGHAVEVERVAEDEIQMRISVADAVAEETSAAPPTKSGHVVLIESRTLGEGDEALGAILMKAFIKTIKEVTPLPSAMLFLNGGVHLTASGSPHLEDLRELEGMGVALFSCGTCLDFFHLQERLAIGKVTNMFDIVSRLTAADRILRP